MRPEFAEREFELCFNAEFINDFSYAIIASPFVPSQREEALHGFDVQFELQAGNIQRSLFLQHKVSHFITNRTSSNRELYDFVGGPYYHFNLRRLDRSRQHNLLYELRQSGEEVYYTAPLFHERTVLTQHFNNNSVMENTILFDPSEVGEIMDLDLHKIVYNQDGTVAGFKSERKKIKSYMFKKMLIELREKRIDKKYFLELFSKLKKGLAKVFQTEELTLPKEYSDLPPISRCVFLLHKYYELYWAIF